MKIDKDSPILLSESLAWKYGSGFSCNLSAQVITEWNVKDSEGNPIPQPSEDEIEKVKKAFLAKLKRDANDYKVKRAEVYPSVEEQLDILYHKGIAGWHDVIQEIKEKYPKK